MCHSTLVPQLWIHNIADSRLAEQETPRDPNLWHSGVLLMCRFFFTRIQKHFLGGEKVTYPSIEMVETTLRRFLPSVLWGVSGTGPLLIRVVIWMIFWAGGDRSVPCKDDWEQSHAVGYHPPWTQVITLRNTKINCSMFQTIHMEGDSQAQAAVLHLIPEGSGWFSKNNLEFWHKIHFRNGDWPALFNLVNTQKSIRPLIWWKSFCDEQKPRLKP